MAESEDKHSWLTDKNTRELRNIGRFALDPEKAKWMKGNAFLLMGQFADFEDNRVAIEKEHALVLSVAKKVTLKDFLIHHESKRTESSKLTKKILARIWMETELSPEERVRVLSRLPDVEGVGRYLSQTKGRPRILHQSHKTSR